ncbi:hypothetical protein LSTR_LSTR005117 [Laodelphax striatellus]|uniref:Bifunctional lysine-specific demethylase and histidyl-hydroxylase n=1 Tax=Laodelphax striatellus TaxID=195883 RepID=A0A482WPR8_LAOST|nr:hypothetical protein LSTR_LSTR005117 [Laodelphax striatellus]
MVKTREQKKNDQINVHNNSPGNKKKKNKKKSFNKPNPFQGVPFFDKGTNQKNKYSKKNNHWRFYNDERHAKDNTFFVTKCVSCGKSTVIERNFHSDADETLTKKCTECETIYNQLRTPVKIQVDQTSIHQSQPVSTPSRTNKKNSNRIISNKRGTEFISLGKRSVTLINDQSSPPNKSGKQSNTMRDNSGNQSKKNSGYQSNVPRNNLEEEQTAYLKDGKSLQWLLQPHQLKDFFRTYWEKKPLLIKRNIANSNDYSRAFNLSTATVDQVLADNALFFTKHVDITSYTNGVRETHNPEGRALPHIVWDMYRNGCSVRFLNPQAFITSIHKISSELQDKLGFVGCNLYLTPAGSQGFAPHYDDIEAFVLQIEGSKHWKVYAPLSESDTLPRYSSKNLSESDLGPPIIDCVLKPGDVLYFPRGFVHQAKTTDEHSLHITLSAYQSTAYVDVFEKVLPSVLKETASKSLKFREGLPLNYTHTFGITRNSKYSDVRSIFTQKLKDMLHDMVENMDYDSAIDQFAAAKLHDDLPLYLTDDVKKCTVFGNRNTIDPDGKVSKVVQLQLDSKVSLLQLNICRLVKEDERYLLYHSMSNSLEYHERDREFLEVPENSIEAVKCLFHTYPNYVKVADLPIDDDEDKWSFANTLWENGLLKTDGPLNKISPEEMVDDESDAEETMD